MLRAVEVNLPAWSLTRSPAWHRRRSRPPAGPGGSRLSIGLGAAIVLLLLVLGVTAAVTAIGQVGHSVEVPKHVLYLW